MKNERTHSFVICAYKESPYLEDCIRSLLSQTDPSPILIVTSTPNAHIKAAGEKYGIKVRESGAPSGIGRDWNFALSCADTDLVTIAHQDDVYRPEYAEQIKQAANKVKNPLILFTDYCELRGNQEVCENAILTVKRKMNALFKPFKSSKFVRNRVLSFGCSICCPSVALNKSALPRFAFDEDLLCSLDWDAWSRIAREKGAFVYIPKPLMLHRIHLASETTKQLKDGRRYEEDYMMYRRYWPKKVAKMFVNAYEESGESNGL